MHEDSAVHSNLAVWEVFNLSVPSPDKSQAQTHTSNLLRHHNLMSGPRWAEQLGD